MEGTEKCRRVPDLMYPPPPSWIRADSGVANSRDPVQRRPRPFRRVLRRSLHDDNNIILAQRDNE